MTMENKVIIAAAGAGKTTYLVDESLKQQSNVLITTFTDDNEAEIHKKFVSINGCVPKHVTIMTWFSFLLQHGVWPFQGTVNPVLFERKIKGVLLVNEQSGLKGKLKNGKPFYYSEENEFISHYFNQDNRIYTDKLAKFVVRANEKTNGRVIDRISRVFPCIYIDEVQDLAGYDLEVMRLLFHSSSNVMCVGDPRQVTYYTHWEAKNKQYRNGKIKEYIKKECYKRDNIIVDESTLKYSHRNNKVICDFSSILFSSFQNTEPCNCPGCHDDTLEHQGIYLVAENDVSAYLNQYNPLQLRNSAITPINENFSYCNFGKSKGKTVDRVLIYPTKGICEWLADSQKPLNEETRAKLYVAITRARYSVAFVVSNKYTRQIQNISVWSAND